MVVDEVLSFGLVGDIVELIEACDFPEKTLLLIECQPDRVIDEADRVARRDLLRFERLYPIENVRAEIKRATSGRVFSENFELRWERLDQGFQAVYLGERREIPGLEPDKEQILQHLTKKDEASRYYLFGTKLDTGKMHDPDLRGASGYFAEVRVPRLLRYPIETEKQRVQLHVREYVDTETGEVQLFRFQNLREAEEKA
jgi:hypothetical protein